MSFCPERCTLGIEFGSTRIKAVLIGPDHAPLAQGDYTWENRLENGVWTYPESEIWAGLQAAYAALAADVQARFGQPLTTVGCLGVSAMMHGYLAFDENDALLVPFRTWRNTITGPAAEALTEAFGFNIPQRWSIAHLYQAMLNKEEHLPRLRFFTTLAGFVHWKLTGRKVLGVGDASGMFPIDSAATDYDKDLLARFNGMAARAGYPVDAAALLPAVLPAGAEAGTLTPEGARLLDPTGTLQPGCPLCPPEGDAGTGMAATDSVAPRTGNVSAGTSIFAMVVLERPLRRVYPEIDLVTTPDGAPVAMVHCNNCTSDLNAWVAHFISGGAQGFDQLAFWAVDKAKREGLAVSNDIFVPFEAQPSRWKDEGLFNKKEYSLMLRMADSVSVIKDGTPEDHKQAAEWLNERNRMMVDSSSIMIALWDRSKGGTGNCVAYANRQNKPVILLSYTLDEKGRLRLI